MPIALDIYYSTTNAPFMFAWPTPQKIEQKNVNVPFLSATNSTVTVSPGARFLFTLKSGIAMPCVTSTLFTFNRTVSPCFTLIVLGSKLHCRAIISNCFTAGAGATEGLGCAEGEGDGENDGEGELEGNGEGDIGGISCSGAP